MSSEHYGLNWPGKRAAAAQAQGPAACGFVVVPEKSLGTTQSRNRIIEGDSLDALKLLARAEPESVKVMYLDPPYNTGNEFVYRDSFTKNAQSYRQSAALDPQELAGRMHSDWLSMMYPRLLLARDLLRPDGVGFISIDGNEVAQLRLLLDEVFGPQNYLGTLVWVSNLKGRQISGAGPVGTHEYIMCFARDATQVSQFRWSLSQLQGLMPAVYQAPRREVKVDGLGPYVIKNQLYNTNSKFNEVTAPTMIFNIHWHPDTGEVRVSDVDDPARFAGFEMTGPHPNARPGLRFHAWRWSRARVLADHANLEFEVHRGKLRIWTKVRDVDTTAVKDLIMGPNTITGQADLTALGLRSVFETPKPVSLLQLLIQLVSSPDDDAQVLDFFAGSGSTAHAAWAANAADGGKRTFTLVQIPEPVARGSAAAAAGFETISELTAERVRRAAAAVGGPEASFQFVRCQ